MEENSNASASDPKLEPTRAGGPDETRKFEGSEEAPPEEQADTPRGVPEVSRSSPR